MDIREKNSDYPRLLSVEDYTTLGPIDIQVVRHAESNNSVVVFFEGYLGKIPVHGYTRSFYLHLGMPTLRDVDQSMVANRSDNYTLKGSGEVPYVKWQELCGLVHAAILKAGIV